MNRSPFSLLCQRPTRSALCVSIITLLVLTASGAPVAAGPVEWVDWAFTGSQSVNGLLLGNNVQFVGEYAFAQTTGGVNFFVPSEPYVGFEVSNPPPDPDIVALSAAGQRTLNFSQAVSDLVFAYVSINQNSYTFNHDFNLLSNDTGYWGSGAVSKVNNNNGSWSLVTLSSEPHGVIQFPGTLTTLTWDVANNEYWNGFTVGTPVPGPLGGVGVGACFLFSRRLRRRIQSGR